MSQLEELHCDKDSLNELAAELRAKSNDPQVQDIDSKTADANDKFTQLQGAMANRFMLIIWPISVLVV